MIPDDRDGPPVRRDPSPISEAAAAPAPAEGPPRSRGGRVRVPGPLRRLRRPRLPRSRRGIAAFLLVLGALGTVAIGGTLQVIHWTETADFCGRCHTMGPELQAHAAGPHREVTCGECHVEPGVDGWLKSKINGTRQLAEIVLGTYPEPIPPPDHDALPSVQDTCVRCHNVDRIASTEMVLRTQYTEDEANTRQAIGLLIRPGSGDVFEAGRGVHWHVQSEVDYRVGETGVITWVRTTDQFGSAREYLAQDEVGLVENVGPDLERLANSGEPHRMDCIDCHNRVGHPISNPRRGLDAAISARSIDSRLPYIKREGMRLLWADYPSIEAADQAIDELRDFYALEYPDIANRRPTAIERAVAEIKVLYRLTATPEIKVTSSTYPDNLGHSDFVGCFRCHDGGHFLVVDGALTSETIPSRCDACHTFPQIGRVASLPLGPDPKDHDDPLFIFGHKDLVDTVDPGGTSCGDCHARDYCVNCHDTGAVTVEHDAMLLDHARVIRRSTAEACAYCHQPVYCARCHADPVMPGSAPWTSPVSGHPEETGLVTWPLLARPIPAP